METSQLRTEARVLADKLSQARERGPGVAPGERAADTEEVNKQVSHRSTVAVCD